MVFGLSSANLILRKTKGPVRFLASLKKEAFLFQNFWFERDGPLFLHSQNGRRVRLRARTPPFHGGNTGSNPVRGTKKLLWLRSFFICL